MAHHMGNSSALASAVFMPRRESKPGRLLLDGICTVGVQIRRATFLLAPWLRERCDGSVQVIAEVASRSLLRSLNTVRVGNVVLADRHRHGLASQRAELK